MAKPKLTPQMIRQMQQVAKEEKIPQDVDQKDIFEKEQPDRQDLDQNDEDEFQQLKNRKEALAKKRIGEIENEMRAFAQQRQDEMRKRRGEIVGQQKQESEQKKTQSGLSLEISSKPKKGMPFWGKRVRTAQQQSQPETAGRRIAG